MDSTIATLAPLLACELYQAWQAARDDADAALLDWSSAPPAGRADAYVAYRAAADREDAAAISFMRAPVD